MRLESVVDDGYNKQLAPMTSITVLTQLLGLEQIKSLLGFLS